MTWKDFDSFMWQKVDNKQTAIIIVISIIAPIIFAAIVYFLA